MGVLRLPHALRRGEGGVRAKAPRTAPASAGVTCLSPRLGVRRAGASTCHGGREQLWGLRYGAARGLENSRIDSDSFRVVQTVAMVRLCISIAHPRLLRTHRSSSAARIPLSDHLGHPHLYRNQFSRLTQNWHRQMFGCPEWRYSGLFQSFPRSCQLG